MAGSSRFRRLSLPLVTLLPCLLLMPARASGVEDFGAVPKVAAASQTRRSRTIIAGSGKDIRLERREEEGTTAVGEPAAGIAEDLVRLARAGLSQEKLIDYAKARRSEIPTIWNADEFAWMRRSGIGERMLGYLAGVSAIDIGETGEPREGAAQSVAAGVPGSEAYAMPYEYPYYGTGYSRGFFPRHRFFHELPPFHRPVHVPPFFPRPMPQPNATTSRFGRAPSAAAPPMQGMTGGTARIY